MKGLVETLEAESFVYMPDRVGANAARTWNRLREQYTDWPDIELTVRRKRVPWTFKLETFPESFQQDIERWFDRLTHPDPFSDTGPLKPLRPRTIEHRRFQIRTMASALVRKEHDREKIL